MNKEKLDKIFDNFLGKENEKDKRFSVLAEKAIEKVGDINKDLVDILNKQEKTNLNNLSNVDEEVTFQGKTFSNKDLQKIKKWIKK